MKYNMYPSGANFFDVIIHRQLCMRHIHTHTHTYIRPVASLPGGGGFVGGPKGDGVGWGGVCVCGGEGITIVSGPGGGGSFEPPEPPWLRTCTCTPIHTYIHTHARTYVRTYIHTHTYINVHTYKHTYVCTYLHTYVRTYIHTHIHTYTRIHTYIHTYIHIGLYIRTYVRTYIHDVYMIDGRNDT